MAVEVTSIVLQSLEGTQTQLNITGDLSLDPLLLVSVAPDSVVCFNVVLQVKSEASQSKLHRMAARPTWVKKEHANVCSEAICNPSQVRRNAILHW